MVSNQIIRARRNIAVEEVAIAIPASTLFETQLASFREASEDVLGWGSWDRTASHWLISASAILTVKKSASMGGLDAFQPDSRDRLELEKIVCEENERRPFAPCGFSAILGVAAISPRGMYRCGQYDFDGRMTEMMVCQLEFMNGYN